jgi:hypothetical protein
MSFFKSLCLAIFATLFLTYALGVSFMELLNVDIYMDAEVIEPLKAISFSALVVVLLVLVALAIAMLLLGVFWPIFLIAFVIWLLARDKRPVQC